MCIANSEAGLSNQVYTVCQAHSDLATYPWRGYPDLLCAVLQFGQVHQINREIRLSRARHPTADNPVGFRSCVLQHVQRCFEPSRLVASSSATDLTSGIATYSWNCAGVTYNAQSPAITISGPDQTYNLSLTVTDCAGNQSVNTFTITKATVPPGQPTESLGSSSYGTKSPMLDQNPNVTWIWNASPNLGLSPDKFLEKLDTETTWTPLPFSTTSLGPSTLADGTYKLMVRQVDAAGNQSPTLNMQIVVTPVIPWDGSTTTTDTLSLQWRDFFQGAGDAPGAQYRVHFWPHGTIPTKWSSITGPALCEKRALTPTLWPLVRHTTGTSNGPLMTAAHI